MAIVLPPALAGLFQVVTGMEWPQGNEDELRAVAQLYTGTAEDFDQLADLVGQLTAAITQDFAGEAASSFVAGMKDLVGGDDYLGAARTGAAELAQFADDTANQIEYMKWMILATLIQLAAELAFFAATAWFNWAAEAEAAAAELAARLAINAVVRKVLQFLLTHVALGMVTAVATDRIIQRIQIQQGHRTSMDNELLKQSVEFAGIGSVVGGLLGPLAGKIGSLLGDLLGRGFGKGVGNDLAKLFGTGFGTGSGPLSAGEARNFAQHLGRSLGDNGRGLAGGFGKEAGGAAKEPAGNLAKGADREGGGGPVDDPARPGGPQGPRGPVRDFDDGAAYAFAHDMGESFAQHLGPALGSDAARELGRDFGAQFATTWGRQDLATVKEGLRGVLRPHAGVLGADGVRALADGIPDTVLENLLKSTGPDVGRRLAELTAASLGGGVNMMLTTGFYNLIFSPDHSFETSAQAFGGGAAMGAIGRGGRMLIGHYSPHTRVDVPDFRAHFGDGLKFRPEDGGPVPVVHGEEVRPPDAAATTRTVGGADGPALPPGVRSQGPAATRTVSGTGGRPLPSPTGPTPGTAPHEEPTGSAPPPTVRTQSAGPSPAQPPSPTGPNTGTAPHQELAGTAPPPTVRTQSAQSAQSAPGTSRASADPQPTTPAATVRSTSADGPGTEPGSGVATGDGTSTAAPATVRTTSAGGSERLQGPQSSGDSTSEPPPPTVRTAATGGAGPHQEPAPPPPAVRTGTGGPAGGQPSRDASLAAPEALTGSREAGGGAEPGPGGPVPAGGTHGSGEVRTDRWIPSGGSGGGPEAFRITTHPDGTRTIERPSASGERTDVGYAWTWTRGDTPGSDLLTFTRRIHLRSDGASPAELRQIKDAVVDGARQLLDEPGYHLPVDQPDVVTGPRAPGPRWRGEVEFVDTPEAAHSVVDVRGGLPGRGQMVQGVWYAGVADPAAYVHEVVHGFGVRDDVSGPRTLLVPGGRGEVLVTGGSTSLMGPVTERTPRPVRFELAPDHLRQMADVFRPHAHAGTLAGQGGRENGDGHRPEVGPAGTTADGGVPGGRSGRSADTAPRLPEGQGEAPGGQDHTVRPELAESTYGMPKKNFAKFRKVAADRNLVIDVRPTNPESVKWLDQGALPKPQDIKAKTINNLDVYLGPSAEHIGLVGYFRPTEPDHAQISDKALYDQVKARYEQRLDEYDTLAGTMQRLGNEGKFIVDGYLVKGRDPHGDGYREITGDHDVFDVTTPGGSRLGDERYDEVINHMTGNDMAVMHGAHVYWKPQDSFAWKVYTKIVNSHHPGGEPLVRFEPDNDNARLVWSDFQPVTANTDTAPALPEGWTPQPHPADHHTSAWGATAAVPPDPSVPDGVTTPELGNPELEHPELEHTELENTVFRLMMGEE